jgi:hypothetical protein
VLGFSVTALVSAGGLTLALFGSSVSLDVANAELRAVLPPPMRFEWTLVAGKHWQVLSSPVESRETTDALEGTRGACPAGMVEVQGRMKVDPSANAYYDQNSIEELQKQTCTKWINRDYPERCQSFDRAKWLELSKELPTQPKHFCVDRFEYPNQKGEYPVIMVNYHEAADLCASEGKRLCDESEWTFACEGEEATPYPYGYERDPKACDIDQPWHPFHETALRPRDGLRARAEIDRLFQGVPSGSRAACRSPFGVYDMTGNVDEWARSVREGERPSILKGGYWGPVRTRCRPSTRSHDENHMFYQQGFRCCADPGAATKTTADPSPAPEPAPAP